MHRYLHRSIIYHIQDLEMTQVPINRQVDKDVVVYIYNKKIYTIYTIYKYIQ